MEDERLQSLLQRYFDQILTVEERAELSQMLLASSKARGDFWEMARWNALIRQWGEAEWGRRDAETLALRPLPSPVKPKKSRKIVAFPPWAVKYWPVAAAAMVAFALVLGGPKALQWIQKSSYEQRMSVAVLTHSADAVWTDGGSARQRGEGLVPGWLRLKSGAVQIEFSRGARVVLEGPAELQLLTDNGAFLRSGKLRAQVPDPAHGFTVQTPQFTVVDHGTEFGCSLPLVGSPQLHVFNGLVSLQQDQQADRQLHQNQAVQIDQGKLQDIPARRDQFLSDDELAKRERASAHGRLVAWRAASRFLSEHPAALLHLDFEGDRGWARNIPNRAWQAIPEAPASMVGCEISEGRWVGKGAVEFNRPDDRLRLNLPGGYQSMTLVAWVRVDSLPDRPQSLVMADGLGNGDVQWYLTRGGELGLGVHTGNTGDPLGWHYHHSPPIVSAETLGSWICVATVFNGNNGTVTHYLNGRAVSADQLPVRTLLQLETFEIGNWAMHSGDQRGGGVIPRGTADSARNLHGRMDELAIFSAPLSNEELSRIYETGKVNAPAVVAQGPKTTSH